MNDADFTGRTIGGFRILRKLGSGGMAVVYKAHEGSLNRVVALKVIHEHLSKQPEFVARFHREARAAAQLNHPHIVQIYAVGEENGMPYFSMEYVKGKSLQNLIETDGFLTVPRAIPILEQTCQALAAAHEGGIIHRDIKPSNIMLDTAGRAKVADFGIAHMVTESRLTQSGMLLGTPGYTSPEQCLGAPLDERSDIYALGVTVYEMLTGQMPFNGDTPAALILQIVKGEAPPLATMNPMVPQGFQQIVEKMIHKNPAERFQSAEDVLEALARRDTRPVTAQRPATPSGEPLAARTTKPTMVRASAEAPSVQATTMTPTDSPPSSPAAMPEAAARTSRRNWISLGVIVPAVLGVSAIAAFVGLRVAGIPIPGIDSSESGGSAPQTVLEQPVAPSEQTAASATLPPVVDPSIDTPVEVPPPVAPTQTASDTTPQSQSSTEPAALAIPVEATVVAAPPRDAPRVEQPVDNGSRSGGATARAAPPPRTIVAVTEGDYEQVDLVKAGIESALIGAGYEIVDFVSGRRAVEDVARFSVASTVKIVGTRQLVFAGRQDIQYTVALTVQATDLASGTRAAGPFSTTVQYTSLNLEDKLAEGMNELARSLIRDLEARLAR